MTPIYSFEPISDKSATRLILGSMPGEMSLTAGQYYAHPRNDFWRIIELVLGIPSKLTYTERCSLLTTRRIALWDVLNTCIRSGSLDSAIVASSIVPNEFERFFHAHPKVRTIFFNGGMAEKIYLKQVLPKLPDEFAMLKMMRLPSTSPANASIRFDEKVRQWRAIEETA